MTSIANRNFYNNPTVNPNWVMWGSGRTVYEMPARKNSNSYIRKFFWGLRQRIALPGGIPAFSEFKNKPKISSKPL